MSWLLFLLLGFFLSGLAPFLVRIFQSYFSLIVVLWLGSGLYFLNQGLFQTDPWVWSKTLELSLAFSLEGVSYLFLNTIFLVGACVFLFASEYMKKSDRLGYFFMALTFFITSMLGLVTADPFILTFIFWELTSFSSYMLIGTFREEQDSRQSALQALLVTGAGGLCLLGGFLILQEVFGTNSFSALYALAQSEDFVHFGIGFDGILLQVGVLLVLLGGLTKSAQIPFHFWLPNAMKAPAPVSALLHSATMVKAGIYLFLKLDPIFNSMALWRVSLTTLGSVTLLLGAVTAYQHTDLKKILAYTTIATLGALTFLIGFEHPMGAQAALLLFVAHAGYKASFFMIAGLFEKITGTRELQKLKGLSSAGLLLLLGSLLSALSMIGVPPTLGFLSKEVLLKMSLFSPWSLVAFVLAFALMGSVAWQLGVQPFLGMPEKNMKMAISKSTKKMALGPFVLGFVGVFLAFDPGHFLSQQFSASMVMGQEPIALHLWEGFHLPLILSLLVIGLAGLGVYLHPQVLLWNKKHHRPGKQVKPFADIAFDFIFHGLLRGAYFLTTLFQNGNLTRYLVLVFGSFLFLSPVLFFKIELLESLQYEVAHSFVFLQVLLGGIILVATGLAMVSEHRLTIIVSMGAIGYSIAALYVLLGAPDLALTQVIVETLSVILFVFLLHKVPLLRSERHFWPNQGVSFFISLSMGAIVTLLTWHALSQSVASPISDFFGENSYLKAYGRNIVNVILVDFRGFDTMGEITVLAIAALVLGALLLKKQGDSKTQKENL
jgi:multicomponent Na+:H+ antiporter subunit A